MNWITQFFDRFFSFVPRFFVVDPDESGMRTTPRLKKGMRVKELSPGWWIVWPVIQNAEKIKIKTQVVDLRPQSIWTKDGKELIISGSIKYRVDSAMKAILDVFDYDDNICTLALGIIFDFVSEHTLDELKRNFKQLKEQILKGLREASRGWGLKIEAVYLTDIGRAKNIRLLINEPFLTIKGEE